VGVNVPRVLSSFKAEENYYIAVEFIEGESLDHWLSRRRRRLAVSAALRCAVELARLVARVHAAGWVWRDCKPGNVLITKDGELRLLDFEGACTIESPDPMPWGTPAYSPPEGNDAFRGQSRLPEDLYSLGATIYLLLSGRPPDFASPLPLERMRRNVPEDARRVVVELLDPNPRRRLDALTASRRLEASLAAEASRHDQGVSLRRRASSANLGSGRRSSYIGSVVK
jgi:serine/threonine protein kinase